VVEAASGSTGVRALGAKGWRQGLIATGRTPDFESWRLQRERERELLGVGILVGGDKKQIPYGPGYVSCLVPLQFVASQLQNSCMVGAQLTERHLHRPQQKA
jgi:hypothetical protein